jgi:peroxiredoxin Q/BCP
MISPFGREGVGAAAPALELPAADGTTRSLGEFRGRPVMVSFLGPAHCPICRAHVIRMIQARDEIRSIGAEVVLVAYHDPELLTAKMLHSLDLPYLLLVDRTKQAYSRWGLGEFGLKSALQPGMYWAVLKNIINRVPSLGTVPDANQLGGDFVINRDGHLAFVNRMKSIHDRAAVDTLIAAVRASGPADLSLARARG